MWRNADAYVYFQLVHVCFVLAAYTPYSDVHGGTLPIGVSHCLRPLLCAVRRSEEVTPLAEEMRRLTWPNENPSVISMSANGLGPANGITWSNTDPCVWGLLWAQL